MSIKVKEDRSGNSKTFVKIEGTQRLTRKAIRQTWFAVGKDLEATASREILRHPKRGRVYIIRTRGGRRRRHVASAPGESHANISGRTRRSIGWKVQGVSTMQFGYGVATTGSTAPTKHGPFLEFGTDRMDPRPSLKNSIDANQRNVETHFKVAMGRALR